MTNQTIFYLYKINAGAFLNCVASNNIKYYSKMYLIILEGGCLKLLHIASE